MTGRAAEEDTKTMGSTASVEAVLAVFAVVGQRDDAALAPACQPDVDFRWPPPRPCGGTARELAGRGGPGPRTGTGCAHAR